MPVVNSASFSHSIAPFYESEYPQRMSTTPLAQSELPLYSQNYVLAQEEIGIRHVHGHLPQSESGRRAGKEPSLISKRKSRAQDRLPAGSDDKNRNIRTSSRQPSIAREEGSRGGPEPRRQANQLLTKSHDHDQRTKAIVTEHDHQARSRVGRFNPYASTTTTPHKGTRSATPSRSLRPTRPRNVRDEVSQTGDHRTNHPDSSDGGMTEAEGERASTGSLEEGSEYDDHQSNGHSHRSLDSREDNVDEDEDAYHGLIPKPEGEAGRPGRGGYNLEQAMGWDRKDYKKLTDAVKKFVEQELDVSKNLGSQSTDSLRIVYALALRAFPSLSDFEDSWPVVDLIRSQLKYRRNQKKMMQTKADALLGRRFKDVASNK